MPYLVIAHDGRDSAAPERRLAARPAHLENLKRYDADGRVLSGGPILEEGRMAGSYLLMDFADRPALDAWLASDPYTTGDVWRDVTVLEVQTVFGAGKP
ncbi:MAG: YciI family protein [Alphaproteobacteria bacterium]